VNVYKVIIEAQYVDDSLFLREGPIYVSAENYTAVEAKLAASPRYKKRQVAEIELLGKLDQI